MRVAEQLGAAAFLPKPVDFDRLKERLAALVPPQSGR
jgi:DNA-binding response OmpR family regulator